MALKRIIKEIEDFKKDPYYNIYYFMEKKIQMIVFII